ncbi:MAG TPA: PAS domain S-box protein [Pyrinomonadaceae bacterium]
MIEPTETKIRESGPLEDQELLFRRLIEDIREYAIYTLDPAGHITSWNLGAERIKGWSAPEVLGKHCRMFFSEEDVKNGRGERELALAAAEGRATDEYWSLRKNGQRFYANVFITALRDEQGTLKGFSKVVRDVTERHEMEERYRNLFEYANDIVYTQDLEGNFTSLNRAGEIITGYSREEVMGMNMSALLSPEDLELARQRIARKLEDGAPTRYDLEIVTKRGERIALEVNTRLIYREGRAVGVQGIARDVTARKAAEAELQRSKKQLEIILQGVADSITAQDQDGRLIFVNEAAVKALGYPSSEALLNTPVQELLQNFELMDEAGEPFPREMLPGRVALKEGRSTSATMRFRLLESGEERWSIAKSTPIFDAAGHVQFAINIFHDITERKRAEDAQSFLAEASRELASSLDYQATLVKVARMTVPNLADWCSVDVVDEQGAVNRLAVAHVDPSKVAWAHELQNRYPPDMDAPGGVPNVLRTGKSELYPEILDSMLAEAAIDDEHLQIMREIGFTSAMVVPLVAHNRTLGAITFISAESGRHYGPDDLALAENLAGRAALAIDNARLYQDAQRANRLKDEFLATLSHELRTPLTAILGWAHLLRTSEFSRETAAGALETIERNARSQSQLIDDLLDVSRIITGKLRLDVRQIDPASFIESAIEALRPAAEAKGVRIQKVIDTSTSTVAGDPSRLQQVIWNLLSNAVKFTPRDGRVLVRLERINSHIEITVSDTGNGIKPDFLPHVFERFRQADGKTTREYGGLGLGLAIVRHLVELHGGTVHAASAGEGQGATFTVKLPVVPILQKESDPEQAYPRARERRLDLDCPEKLDDLNVLVLDDEADARALLEAVLTKCGATVRTASTVNEALELLQELKPDVLVSDIGMPGEDGYQLIGRVRALTAEEGGKVPAIALTAYARAEDRLRALRAGYQMHVPKPVEPAELVAVVASLAGRSARLDKGK